jgi:hypothetical protein
MQKKYLRWKRPVRWWFYSQRLFYLHKPYEGRCTTRRARG